MSKHNLFSIGFLLIVFLGFVVVNAGSETESNDTFSSANTIAGNGNDTGSLSRSAPVDIYDFYRVQLNGDGSLRVLVTSSEGLQVQINLVDADEISIIATVTSPGGAQPGDLTVPNLYAGRYYIVLYTQSGSGTYSIAMTHTPQPSSENEPNDIPANAIDLALNQSIRGNLGFQGQQRNDYNDYYRFTTTTDGSITFSVQLSETLNGSIQIVDTNGFSSLTSPLFAGPGATGDLVLGNLTAGTYYLLVNFNQSWGGYTVSNVFTPLSNVNDREPNHQWDQAISLSFNSTAENQWESSAAGRLGYIGGRYQDERDFYSITTPTFGALTLNAQVDASFILQVSFNIYNSQHQLLGTLTNQSSINALPAGQYYVETVHSSGFGPYSLLLQLTQTALPEPYAGPRTDLAPDNGSVTASLPEGSTAVYYRLIIPADGQLQVNVPYPDTLYGDVSILTSDGLTVLAGQSSFYVNETKVVNMPNLLAGEYLLRASRYGGQGNLNLSTHFTSSTKNDVESNDDWSALTPMELNHSFEDQILSGHIGFKGNNGYVDRFDIFRFNARTNGNISVNLTADDTLYYGVFIYGLHDGTWRQLSNHGSFYSTEPITFGKDGFQQGECLLYIALYGGYGSYQASIDYTARLGSDREPNDHYSLAQELPLNAGTIGQIGFENALYDDYNDWYKITLPQDGALTVHLTADASVYQGFLLYNSPPNLHIANSGSFYSDQRNSLSANYLRAGTYYLQVARYGQQGSYQIVTEYRAAPFLDVDGHDYFSIPLEIQIGQIVEGNIGHKDVNTMDSTDWYRVTISTGGRMPLIYQAENSLYSSIYLYNSQFNGVTNLGQFYDSTLQRTEVTLEAGTYIFGVYHSGGAGSYTFALGRDIAGYGGTLQGTVTNAAGPLNGAEVIVMNRTALTQFDGQYSLTDLLPGRYLASIRATGHHTETREVTIERGQIAELNVVLRALDTGAPGDVPGFYGQAYDRYAHLYWLPSDSPVLSDGGGYKLYIDNNPVIDMKTALTYRADNLINGVTYNFRLTVYDKAGRESPGRTLQLTPQQDGTQPTPTAVPVATATNTPTPSSTPTTSVVPFTPTPTPTSTLTSTPSPVATPTATTVTVPPSPTPTWTIPPAPPTLTPTATLAVPSSTPTAPAPTATTLPGACNIPALVVVYEFERNTLADNGWSSIPGGFQPGTPPGVVLPLPIQTGMIPESKDQRGLGFIIKGSEVAFVYANEAVDTQGHPCLIRAVVRSDNPAGQVALAALKGQVLTGTDLDGSIATHIPQTAASFANGAKQLVLVYQPDTSNILTPVIQVAGTGSTQATTIYVDRLEVFRLDQGCVPVELFSNIVK